MPRRRRGVLRIGYALTAVVVAATMAIGGTYLANADTNKSDKRLVVYNNNIENRLPEVLPDKTECEGGNNWNALVSYLKKQPKSPDIFTVQQVSNSKDLKKLTGLLSDALPGNYTGKIAVGNPGSMGYDGDCGKVKNQQTNAVIYRYGRLSLKESRTWRSDALKGNGECSNLDPSGTPSQDRVVNVGVKLWDKEAKKHVSVASIHWPTKRFDGPQCAHANIREASKHLKELGGALQIMGGDTNAKTYEQDWWKKSQSLEFRDPIAEECGGRVCSSRWDTLKKRRIDHILVRSGSGFSHVDNVTWDMAGDKYSNHRAVTAYVKY